MELIQQNNNFDCGICSLMMLLEHYKIKGIEREELYKNVYIEKTGISIIELETLAHKYGIFLDSYEATFSEICNDKTIKNPFILVTNENDNLHYIVAIKKDKYLKIYDPKGVVKKVPFETPLENYVDIFIKSEKLPDYLKYKKFSKDKKVNYINYGYIFFNVFINLLLLFINFTTSFITSQLLNRIGLVDYYALLATCFGLIIFYIINSLLEYIVFRLSFKKLNKMYLINITHLINVYNFKLPGFYKTIDQNIINNSHAILKNNIFFINEFICNCVVSTLFIFISFLIIFTIDPKFILFVLINLFSILLISLFDHKYTNELTKISIDQNNKIQELAIKINQFNLSNFSHRLNALLFYKLKTKIKDNEYSTYKINNKKIIVEIIKGLWNSLFYLIIITYYIFINKESNIGNLFFCLQIISTLNKYSMELIDSISDSFNFKIIKEVLSNLFNINNLKRYENNELLNFKKDKALLIKKTNFDFNRDIFNNNFKIQNIQITKINHFNDLCHYIKYESLTDLVLELTKSELNFNNKEILSLYKNFLRHKLVFDDNKYSQLEYLIMYLFYLCTQNEQIVIIDSDLEVSINHKHYMLLQKLLNHIKEQNMLILINSLIIKYLDHNELNLNYEENI